MMREEVVEDVDVECGGAAADDGGAYFQEEAAWYLKPLAHPAVQQTWDAVQPVLYNCYVTMDYIGEKVADALGLTQSRFQYVIDEHNRIEERKRKKEDFIRKRLLEERAKERARLGIDDDVGNAVSMPPTAVHTLQPDAPEGAAAGRAADSVMVRVESPARSPLRVESPSRSPAIAS
eukprot:TRINITY_DN1559_c0_g5_i1.p1 TRINITY_DN1559_c0_g5~~TRINITY_DN1559_c0_g5_i1.p1  ORF type:complete len:177 (+),score=66.92 TRINITY_DN1559_c0_g5_i1:91-621(+)